MQALSSTWGSGCKCKSILLLTQRFLSLRNSLSRYAFDVIGELYFGSMFGFMQDRHDYGSFIASLDALVPVTALSGVSPPYIRPLIFPAALLSPKSTTRNAIRSLKHIMSAARSCVMQRQQDMKDGKPLRRDMLDKLFSIHAEKGEKHDFQIRDIEQEAFVALYVISVPQSFSLVCGS